MYFAIAHHLPLNFHSYIVCVIESTTQNESLALGLTV